MLSVNDQIQNSHAKDISESKDVLLVLTAQIVSSHLTNADLSANEVPRFIESIHDKLIELSSKEGSRFKQEPALPIAQSVTPDYIYCLEDGKKFRMLKKHLRTYYNMSPEEYRAKWGLSTDYPMVAPNYAIKRQELARQSGLGKKRS